MPIPFAIWFSSQNNIHHDHIFSSDIGIGASAGSTINSGWPWLKDIAIALAAAAVMARLVVAKFACLTWHNVPSTLYDIQV